MLWQFPEPKLISLNSLSILKEHMELVHMVCDQSGLILAIVAILTLEITMPITSLVE